MRLIWRKKAGLLALAVAESMTLESQAKSNAPWKDRTGNARQLLTGTAEPEGEDIVIRLTNQVEYGDVLERGHSGRYAIVRPTMDQQKKKIKTNLMKFWET